jgi:hypothetical protein
VTTREGEGPKPSVEDKRFKSAPAKKHHLDATVHTLDMYIYESYLSFVTHHLDIFLSCVFHYIRLVHYLLEL